MNTNIVISLDTRRAKQDGTYPLMMRLGHNERTTSIPLNIALKAEHWDTKKRLVRKSYGGAESVTRLNMQLDKRRRDAMAIILKLQEEGRLQTLSLTEIKERILQSGQSQSFYKFSEQLIADLTQAKRIGTARSYRDVLNVVRGFMKGKELTFQKITYDWLNRFEASHIGKGNSYNGLAVYMRTIRAIYNKAIKTGIVEKEFYPFNDYKLKTVPTEKRALDWDLLKRVIEAEIEPDHPCFHARNYFVASYLMYGMNYVDMAFLRRENIKDGRIQYRRRKTSKLYDIKITTNLNKILSYYLNETEGAEYVFPIIKRDSALMQYRDIEWSRKRYNKKLKALAELCGIEQKLTSYVSRHSFATQAMLQEVPITAISSMLGHSSLKTTQVYLKSLPSNILDEYNDRIVV